MGAADCTAPDTADALEKIAGRLSGIHCGLGDLLDDVLTGLRDLREDGRSRGELYVLLVDALRSERDELDRLKRALVRGGA
jgi:hypothetical protein